MRRILFIATLLALAACSAKDTLTVEGGRIRGIPSEAPGVTVFKGIPYAAAPVGELRWKAPQPVTPWEGVRVCDSFGAIAWQNGNTPGTFYGDEFYWEGTPECSEDCLFLNVWAPTKTLNSKAGLPVAFWIHGGAYIQALRALQTALRRGIKRPVTACTCLVPDVRSSKRFS